MCPFIHPPDEIVNTQNEKFFSRSVSEKSLKKRLDKSKRKQYNASK